MSKRAETWIGFIGTLWSLSLIWYFLYYSDYTDSVPASDYDVTVWLYHTGVNFMIGFLALLHVRSVAMDFTRAILIHIVFHRIGAICFTWWCYFNEIPTVWNTPIYTAVVWLTVPIILIFWLLVKNLKYL